MANAFDAMAARMDAATTARLGRDVVINGTGFIGVESHFLPEMGPVSGDGLSIVVFSPAYRPHRNDQVVYQGESYIVTRHQMFNGKTQIWLE
ncbi:MAG: DNA breaking-rejoining protein [Rouxiella aceris]|uniref:DNA breaking-rejoining protein n=1 Tax=Rouxiella aceris TaxID=2703884 RepID=UPI0028415505|nr:DNA breaking-rejoining protein [Rouxiella aceris]MDR3431048.1 DNA breaking-rejoining protein [Rouxiella aceris]